MDIIERIFKLQENNTNIKTELIAGLTTFFTMSYLLILSPKILENAGLNFESTITVTALIVFIGSILMGFIANKPYAIGPFLGETAFISYTIVNTLGLSIKTALAAICLCGVILLIMTLSNIREYIIRKIPENIKTSFCCGLGLFFIFIGLRDLGIVKFTNKAIPLEFGNILDLKIILGLIGILLLITLVKKGIKSSVIITIISMTILGIIFRDIELPEKFIALNLNITPSIFQLDFIGILNKNFIPIFFVIFMLVNIDTAGAIIGLSYKTEEKVEDKKTMIADSLSVILAPILGTTTTGAYLDSMTGISAGGRTGLTAITVGILFLFGIIFSPLITVIPSYAYAPALLYVGIMMTTVITKIDFNDISEYVPAIITICLMIFTYNIGTGIISAFVIYPLVQILCGNKNKTNIIVWIMFVLSIIFFIIYPY